MRLTPIALALLVSAVPALAQTASFRTVAPRAAFATTPPAPQGQDPADSLYRAARQMLNRNNYASAAALFQEMRGRYPRSTYTADAYYWEAFARYRRGGDANMRAAAALLREQAEKHAQAATRVSGDARALEARIQGSLARGGDEEAARRLAEQAELAAVVAPTPPAPPSAARTPRPAPTPRPAVAPGRAGRYAVAGDECRDEGNDVQATALNALHQMDADKALPILKKVLARRDEGSACLRRKAVFLVSQHEGSEIENILLAAARTDPDAGVRGQAIFWLSQVDSPRATAALDSIATTSKDPELQEKAIFALSQQDSPEAARALRRFAERSDISDEARSRAVFWLGQSDDPENGAYLRTLYGKTTDVELKDRILFGISQQDDPAARKFLLDAARNGNEPLEVRKKAIFFLGQNDETTGAELASLYATFADREMKEHLIFVLSQSDDKAAVDKLLDIARREPDKELRKRAIFWLSQSDDPRVADFLAELLEKP
ncbi:MAG TPA: HEAT repeat domain-containing protein [Gemmatimonadales bacterium]